MKNNITAFNFGYLSEITEDSATKQVLNRITHICEKHPDSPFSVFFMAGKKEAVKEKEKSSCRMEELNTIEKTRSKSKVPER